VSDETKESAAGLRISTCVGAAVLAIVGVLALSPLIWQALFPRRCVAAGTLVATPDGPRPIEALRVGDRVWSRAATGERAEGRLTAVVDATATASLWLVVDGGARVRVTDVHPVALADGRWVEAGRLRPGDRLVGEAGPARLLSIERASGDVRVFDLSVEPHACFWAGGLLVHNKMGPESSAIGSLKTLNTAQTLFREGDKDNDGTLDYGTLMELSDATLIDGVLGSGTKYLYRFEAGPSPLTSEFLWFAVANPVDPEDEWTDRYFCTNHAGVIYYTTAGAFTFDLKKNPDCSIPSNALPVGK
jgi:hypothetical protein